jgi:hypothetical protein
MKNDSHISRITISMQNDSSKNFSKVPNIKLEVITFVQFLNWHYKTNWRKLDIENIDYSMNMFNNIITKSNYSDLSFIKEYYDKINLFYIAYLKCHIKHNASLDQFHETLRHFIKKYNTPEEITNEYCTFLEGIEKKYNHEETTDEIFPFKKQKTQCSLFPYELVYLKRKSDCKDTTKSNRYNDLFIKTFFEKIDLNIHTINHSKFPKIYKTLKNRTLTNKDASISLYVAFLSVINNILPEKNVTTDDSFWGKWDAALLDYFEKMEWNYTVQLDTIESYCSLLNSNESKSLLIKNKFPPKPDIQSLDQENINIMEDWNNIKALEEDDDPNISLIQTSSFIDYLPEFVDNFLVSLYDWIVNCFYGTMPE